jgi:membrane protease YdiL (CAAX protease family)
MTINVATPRIVTTTDEEMQVRRARRGLLVFAGFLIPLSLFGYWFLIKTNLPFNFSIWPMMFAPGLASIITRLVRREGFADVSFRLRGNWMRSAYLLAFALPLVVGGIAYGFAYLTGLAKFDPPPFPVAMGSPLAQFGVILVFAAIAGMVLGIPTSTGEEVGWRGYLLPRLIQARVAQPILLTSLIWGAWHLPVIFAGALLVGPSHWFSAATVMVAALPFVAILSWVRLRTGSIWPSVMVHTLWNALINGGFTFATQNPTANIWIAENGILVIVTFVLAVLFLSRTWKPASLMNA